MGIGDIKSPDLYPSFIGFNAIHLKFCNNMEITIPKKTYVLVFQILAFFAGKWRHRVPAKFCFRIMEYLMMVSERSHHKDVKGEKIFQIYLSIQKI